MAKSSFCQLSSINDSLDINLGDSNCDMGKVIYSEYMITNFRF